MNSKEKRTLIICGCGILLLTVFMIVLSRFKIEKPEAVVYPAGNLSDSIFDSQNSEYVANDAFGDVHEFKYVPYTIDTITTAPATVDTGTIYKADNYYFYYAEIPKDEKMGDIIRKQFSQVLQYGVDPDSCLLNVLVSEVGFINGFSAEYQVSHMSVPVETEASGDAYIVSYRLTINDNDDFKEKHDLVIGVITKSFTTDALESCKKILDANVYTIQYDTELASHLMKESESSDISTEDTDTENTLNDANDFGANTDTNTGTDAGTLTNDDVDKTVKTMGVQVDKDYNDLSVIVDWTNLEANPTVVFSDIREQNKYQPSESSAGRVVFHVGEAKAGVYMLKINGWENAGTFTSQTVENAPAEESQTE